MPASPNSTVAMFRRRGTTSINLEEPNKVGSSLVFAGQISHVECFARSVEHPSPRLQKQLKLCPRCTRATELCRNFLVKVAALHNSVDSVQE
eukprot:6193591-Pleurochrysis_carterae.AAC.1